MFGGLVNAFLRPLQSILPQQQQQQVDNHKSNSHTTSSSAFPDATPLKPFPASSFFTPGPNSTLSSAPISPSPTPASPTHPSSSSLHASSEFAPLATPAFTPAPKATLFKQSNQLNHTRGRAHGARLEVPARKNRFSVHDTPQPPPAVVVEEEDEHDATLTEPISEEDKENHVGGKKRPPSPSTPDTSAANGEEAPQFHMGTTANKRMKLDSNNTKGTTDSPRKPRKSLRSSAAVQTASIFNFGPLSTTQRHVPLFTSKIAGMKAAPKPTKREGELSHSLGGVQISQQQQQPPPTHIPNPFQSAAAAAASSVPIANPFARQPSFTASAQPPAAAAPAPAPAPQPSVVIEDTDVEMRDTPTEGAVSPGSHLPMHGMSISSSSLPSNSFRAMSLAEPPNPFNNVQGQTIHDTTHAQRVKAHRASREAHTKEAYASIRASRAADKVEAQRQTAATEGARIDIKTKTKAAPTPRDKILSQQQTYNPHVPVMRSNAAAPRATAAAAAASTNKPPVPLFWESNNSNMAASSSSSSHKPFTPLVPDALFAAAKNAAQNASPAILNPSAVPSFSLHSVRTQHPATTQQPPSAHAAPVAAAPTTNSHHQKDAAEKARVSIKHGCTAEGVSSRVEQNRRDREHARAEATRKGREKALHQRREAAAMNHHASSSSSGSEMEQDASPSAESPTATRPLRRSARHSISPSVSPSPPPPMGVQTPSPRNRFVTPIVTPAAAANNLNTPSPVAHERRTRASMRASPSPPAMNIQPQPQKTAEQLARQKVELAQSIASRKANEQAAAADRLRERQAAMRASEQQAQKEALERDEWKSAVSRRVAQRSRGKNFLGLLAEFTPGLRAELKPSDVNNLDALRKMMRKAMAKFHPDKHTNSPAKNKLEAEEIFVLLKKAYDELTALCR